MTLETDHRQGMKRVSQRLPLTGLRVVDMTDGKVEMCARYLADLGAEVILVESTAGSSTRHAPPIIDGASARFATHHANKLGLTLDPSRPVDCERLRALLGEADVLIEGGQPDGLSQWGIDIPALLAEYPTLIITSISDFGRTGPYRDYVGTGAVHMAIGVVLCRSGLPGMTPLLPPPALAYETTAIQAAWCVLLAVWNRRLTGLGDHLDVSAQEAVAQLMDPALGMAGSAMAGESAMIVPRGRLDADYMYPIFPCTDGFIRICLLAPRQWHAIREWMGEPEELMGKEWDGVYFRFAERARFYPRIAALFADHHAASLVAEGQRRGVPIAEVKVAGRVLRDDHFLARSSFQPITLNEGLEGIAPAGYAEINGSRVGIRQSAPEPNSHTYSFVSTRPGAWSPGSSPAPVSDRLGVPRPFGDLRVLDLGVIVAGAELGRLFADQGAEVIKIENSAYPDGARQSVSGNAAITPNFAIGHRGKLSFGLNLRAEDGKILFMDLAAQADVILSNFRPGTLESLGIGYDEVVKVNPRIIMADSSALGSRGPKSRTLGYGPLVRAETGLTGLWSYPDVKGSFSDGITTFPDHFAARIAAVAVLACLLGRETSGEGAGVSVAQAEAILTAFSAEFLCESLVPGSFVATGNLSEFDAPHGVFPCLGDDEWCVIACRDDRDWGALVGVLGYQGLTTDERFLDASARVRNRAQVDALVASWTANHAPQDVMHALQSKGIPAGAMIHLDQYTTDPHLTARGFVRNLTQPGFPKPLPAENGPCVSLHLKDPDLRPAPLLGQHTREIASRLLGLSALEIDAYIESGVLECADTAMVAVSNTPSPVARDASRL